MYNILATPGSCGAVIRAVGHTRAAVVSLGFGPRGHTVLRQVVQGRPGVLSPCAARPRVVQEVPAARSRRRGEILER